MRTNIVIDDDLLAAAHEATGLKTKKAVVERGLQLLVKTGRETEALSPLWEAIDTGGEIRLVRKGGQPD